MKKILLMIAGLALVTVACNKKENDAQSQLQTENVELSKKLSEAQDSKDSLIFLMSNVYDGIEQINIQEELLYNIRGTGDEAAQRQTIIDNLNRIQQELKNKQEIIDKFTAQLNDQNDKNGALAAEVAKLKKLVIEKENRVVALQQELANLKTENTQLKENLATTQDEVRSVTASRDSINSESQAQKAQLRHNEVEMNKVYYAIGTKKELKANQILGKGDKVLLGNYNQNYFTQADKRSLMYIECKNKKAKVLTAQPVDSYRFEKNADNTQKLVIINPEKFWNASRYLVIKVG